MFKLGYIASSIRRAIGKLLDLYPNAAAAYSLRKLRTDYSGSAVRVRRSIDNTEQDIGFDGSGNLDEAALATFVGNGNAFTYSEQFDNLPVWAQNAITVTANQTTSPNGTTTADLIAETATTASHNSGYNPSISFINGLSYTSSFYFKKGNGLTAPDIIQLTLPTAPFGASQYANFNISTGVVTFSTGGTAIITSVGSGWYRCSWTATATATASGQPGFVLVNNNPSATRAPSYLGLTTSNVYAWGAQLNAGSTAQPYVQTVANQAGFGYVTKWYDQSGTPLNLFFYSEQFDNAAWTKSLTTVTANQATAPDGSITADLISETATTGIHEIYPSGGVVNTIVGVSYTVSCYFKKGIGATAPDIVQMTLNVSGFGGSQYANFNINTGVVTFSTGGTATITAAANGFYRCSFTATATSNRLVSTSAFNFANNNPSSGRLPSYLGQTTSNVYIWGAQLVQGSLPLTYVKTEAANSNRDVVQTTAANQPAIVTAGQIERQGTKPTVYFNGSTNNFSANNGVLISQPNTSISVVRQSGDFTNRYVYYGTTSNQALLTNSSKYISIDAGTQLASTTLFSINYKLIFSLFNGASSTISQNGISIASGNAGTNNLNGLRIAYHLPSNQYFIGYITELIYYPSNQTVNQSGIQTDINTYYTIY